MPDGTTSFYFRTRQALLHATASRIADLDLADLSLMSELAHDESTGYSGTLGLARLVMLSGTEPYLTRTRARFEILLAARSDDHLASTMSRGTGQFVALAREVIEQWYRSDPSTPDDLIDQRAVMVMTFISGVITTFMQGTPVISDARDLDSMIRHILGQ